MPMFFQGIGAIFNIILDPVLIFGWFGLPAMGVQGAAIATVAAQILAAVLSMGFFLKKCPSIKINFKGFRLDGAILKKNLYGGNSFRHYDGNAVYSGSSLKFCFGSFFSNCHCSIRTLH